MGTAAFDVEKMDVAARNEAASREARTRRARVRTVEVYERPEQEPEGRPRQDRLAAA
jgi:hypothetical protein